MIRLTRIWISILALAGLSLAAPASGEIMSLTDPATQTGPVEMGGSLWDFFTHPGSGSGNLESFLSLQAKGGGTTEKGYSSSSQPVDFDRVPGAAHNQDITLSGIPLTQINGTDYRTFVLDVAEPQGNGKAELDLNRLILIGDTMPGLDLEGDEAGLEKFLMGSADMPLIYDLDADEDNTLTLADHAAGNGRLDYVFRIPNANFSGLADDAYISLFAEFSRAGGSFEEFALFPFMGPGGPGGPGQGPAIPEPASLLLWALSALALNIYWRRRRCFGASSV